MSLERGLLIYEFYTKPLLNDLRKRLEKASDDDIKEIIRKYESAPIYKRLVRTIFFNIRPFFKTNIEYICARDMLNGTFSWSKLDEQERIRKKEEEIRLLEEKTTKQLIEKGKCIELFPGSLKEYERLKGYEYEIVDLLGQDKSVLYWSFSDNLLLTLAELDIEALVRYKPSIHQAYYETLGKGIPVKKRVSFIKNKQYLN